MALLDGLQNILGGGSSDGTKKQYRTSDAKQVVKAIEGFSKHTRLTVPDQLRRLEQLKGEINEDAIHALHAVRQDFAQDLAIVQQYAEIQLDVLNTLAQIAKVHADMKIASVEPLNQIAAAAGATQGAEEQIKNNAAGAFGAAMKATKATNKLKSAEAR